MTIKSYWTRTQTDTGRAHEILLQSQTTVWSLFHLKAGRVCSDFESVWSKKNTAQHSTYTTCLKAFWPTDLQCSTCWGQVTRRSWTRPYWKRQPALAILRSYVRYLNRGPWLKHCSVSVGVSVVSESESSPVESNRVSMEVVVGALESSRIQMRQQSFIDLTVGQFTVTQW